MSDNRQWMYARYNDRPAFERGLEGFLEYAINQIPFTDGAGKIKCPCRKCQHTSFLSVQKVREHVTSRGFVHNYNTWVYHGGVEPSEATRMDEDDQSSNKNLCLLNMHEQSEETGLSTYELNYELFLYSHKKEDGTYATSRDEKLDAMIHQIAAEEGRTDLNEIYLEICHPYKSRRYGTESEGESQLSRGSRISGSSASGSLSQEMFWLSTLKERVAEQQHVIQKAEEDRAAERAACEALEQRMAMFEEMVRSGQFPPRPPPE